MIKEGLISADSHVTEPPNCYQDYIDKKYRDDAPYVAEQPDGSEAFIIRGANPVPFGLMKAAGLKPQEIKPRIRFHDHHLSGSDPTLRAEAQDRDNIAAEILFASVGLMLNAVTDMDYKQACFDAYNRWLAEYCAELPERVFGLGQTAIVSVDQAIADFQQARKMDFVGIMMPGEPAQSDYDDPMYDELWSCAEELDLTLAFHIFTTKKDITETYEHSRGPLINGFMNMPRAIQDTIGLFVLGGVLERHPKLRLASSEGDTSWAPHLASCMDRAHKRHHAWLKGERLSQPPSFYIDQQVYFTFQTDWPAFKCTTVMNPRRIMWANDFCLLYTSPSPRDGLLSRMPSSA